MNKALADYNRNRMAQCHQTAMKQAKADSSDPFTYDRVFSHLLNGLCPPSDYFVDFHKEGRTTEGGKSYSVDVPVNRKTL